MTEKISGYTAKEWCERDDLKLVIKVSGEDEEFRFKEHFIAGEPSWPPLEPNGDEWEIIEV